MDVLYIIISNAVITGLVVSYFNLRMKENLSEASKQTDTQIDKNNKEFSDILHLSIPARIKDSIKVEVDILHKRINAERERISHLEYGQAATEKELGRMSVKIESIQQELRVIEKLQDKTHLVVEGIRDNISKVFTEIDTNKISFLEMMERIEKAISTNNHEA